MLAYESEVALDILFRKYSILISKKIRDFHLTAEFDDNFQECLIALSNAINTYIDSKSGFFPYFSTILNNKLVSILRKNKTKSKHIVELSDMVYELRDSYQEEFYGNLPDEEIFKGLTNIEKLIIDLKYLKNWSVNKIAEIYEIKEMRVYYHLRTARDKIKKNYERINQED